jgi:cytochrome c
MKANRRDLIWAGIGILILGGLVVFVTVRPSSQPPRNLTTVFAGQSTGDADSELGRHLLADFGCGSCHYIPGVAGANAYVGPPLNNWSQRRFIAGSLPNIPENLTTWIVVPQSIEPDTAMPSLGVTQQEARHMSAYLYSLGN